MRLASLGILAVAFFVRAIPVVSSDFPLNDGGMFVVMVEALRDNGWVIPRSVAWNGIDLPFAYPPLGIYLAGALDAAGLNLLDVLRTVPLAMSAASAVLVFLLAYRISRSTPGAIAGGLTYAFAPAAFEWPVSGGGITRAPGIFLALASLLALLRILELRDRPRWSTISLGVASAATAMAHPGAFAFLVLSVVVILIRHIRCSGGLDAALFRQLGLAALVAALVVLPWVVQVASWHGLAFALPASNGPSLLEVAVSAAAGRLTNSAALDLLAVVVVAYSVLEIVRGRFLLPAWWFAAALIGFQYAMIPVSLLIARCVRDQITPRDASDPAARWATVSTGILTAAIVLEAFAGVNAPSEERSPLRAISPERRAAMAWVADNLPEDAGVAVVTGRSWGLDADSEWFYMLAERRSIATVQGWEWLGADAFRGARVRHQTLQRCADEGVECVSAWLKAWPAEYLYLPKGRLEGAISPPDCCTRLRASISHSPQYEIIYDGPGATVFRNMASDPDDA